MFNLKNKTSVITGASRGIGKSIAINLAENGSDVCLLSRDLNELDKVKSLINKSTNVKASIYSVDTSDYNSVNNTIKKIINESDRIDILVNNAGITRDNILLKMNENEWKKVIDVNLTGYFNTSKSVIRQMIKQKYGRIINISSVVGLKGNQGQVNYSASKAGIIGLTNSLAKEVGSRNITVNTLAPGYIETDMTDKLDNSTKDDFLSKTCIKRFGTTQDIANAVCFLASDLAEYITGQTINVDGGMD